MALLSSLQKLKRYTGLDFESGNEKELNRSRLLSWQASVSSLVESYCMRGFLIEARTEKFNVSPRQLSFLPKGVPLVSIGSIKADTMGRYDGTSDYTLDSGDYRIGVDGMSVVLNYPVTEGLGALQIVHTGGLAYHAVRSVFTATITGSLTNGWYAVNDTGSAVGIVRASGASSLTLENLYGVFATGDTLSFATSEAGLFKTGSTGLLTQSAVITAISQQSLAEAYPDLERAVEVEVRYMSQHQRDFENVSTLDGQTQRRQQTVWQSAYVFQPETLSILGRYRRILL
jgi:hypothetical protein